VPRILVTNDDGINAPGLEALAAALEPLGEITVVAPSEESSAVSHALTVRRPLCLTRVSESWYSVDGTPTDCINVGITDVLGQVPDLVVSGINNGLNVGEDVTYSGTVGGALEGVLLGAPGVAVSLQRGGEPMNYEPAAVVARRLAAAVLREGLPPHTLLNVNVPRDAHRGIRATVQGRRKQAMAAMQAVRDAVKSMVWIGAPELRWEKEPTSDYAAIQAGWVSVTPLNTDWTNHAALSATDALARVAAADIE
jgi:5'-nucleotidase